MAEEDEPYPISLKIEDEEFDLKKEFFDHFQLDLKDIKFYNNNSKVAKYCGGIGIVGLLLIAYWYLSPAVIILFQNRITRLPHLGEWTLYLGGILSIFIILSAYFSVRSGRTDVSNEKLRMHHVSKAWEKYEQGDIEGVLESLREAKNSSPPMYPHFPYHRGFEIHRYVYIVEKSPNVEEAIENTFNDFMDIHAKESLYLYHSGDYPKVVSRIDVDEAANQDTESLFRTFLSGISEIVVRDRMSYFIIFLLYGGVLYSFFYIDKKLALLIATLPIIQIFRNIGSEGGTDASDHS